MNSMPSFQLNFPDTVGIWNTPFAIWKAMAKGVAENEADESARLRLAQAVCGTALDSYWREVCKKHGCALEIRTPVCTDDVLDETVFLLDR